MAIFGNSQELIEERRYLRSGEVEVSERTFNLVIGGVLLWGFLLNYLMVALFGPQITRFVEGIGILPFLIGYFVMVIIGSVMIGKGGAAMSFLGYNLIALPIGVVVCACVDGVPMNVVKSAVLVTAIVTLSFMILGTLFPDFFLGMGRVLIVGLSVAIVAELITALIFRRVSPVYEWGFVALFSLYIGYDWARANTCARTVDNAVDLAATLYLDIINLFLRVLEIMSRRKD
ncbi:MAG: US12 family protein [Clostridia bacterium]|nr:US12 family protein [Clostridia bacterium]